MDITVERCNNIEYGRIGINEGLLNIKYAINGTGKTTLSKAISYSTSGQAELLKQLTPFKHRAGGVLLPLVTGIETAGNVRIFDEAYINSFVFQQDDLLKGSFDVFIKTNNYDAGLIEIENLTNELKVALADDPDIEGLIKDFDEISSSFGKPTKTGIHASSNLAKALKDGNKVENIPEGLEAYKPYIRHESGYKWIKWQQDGSAYLNLGEDCPYCTSDIKTKRETIERVATAYDSKAVENLNRIVGTFERLNKYFGPATKEQIERFVKNIEKYSDEQIAFLHEVKGQIDLLCNKFKKCRSLSFASLKDVDKVIEGLNDYKIDLSLFNHLQSDETAAKVKIVNDGIGIFLGERDCCRGLWRDSGRW